MFGILTTEIGPLEKNSVERQPKLLQTIFQNFGLNKHIPTEIDMEKKENADLVANLLDAKKELDIATANYEFVYEQDLIDYYAYEIKAAQIRYQYLLKKAKERNISIEDLK